MLENLIGYVAALFIVSACLSVVWLKTRAHQNRVASKPVPRAAECDVDEMLADEFRQLQSGIDQRVF
jgi:hypothetical protein